MKKKYIAPDTSAVKLYTINGLLQPGLEVGTSTQSTGEQLTKSRHEENSDEKDWGEVEKSIW